MVSNKTVPLHGNEYQLGRLPSDVGAFILMRMIGAGINAGSLATPDVEPAVKPDHEPTGEELVRAVCFAAFLRGLSFEDLCFVQRKCMGVVAWLNAPGLDGKPIPVLSDDGRWVFPEIGSDLQLVMQLTVETLVFNLSDFFSGGGLGSLMGTPSKNPTTR